MTDPGVLIIGGGAAGVAAAVGAAQHGVPVALLEKNSFLGGKATASYVGTVCGLYYRSENDGINYAHSGFPMEFAESLSRKSNSTPIRYKEGLKFLSYEDSVFKELSLDYLRKTKQSYFLNAQLVGAEVADNRIVAVTTVIDGNKKVIQPGAVIDTSGFNLVASLLNLNSITSDHYQAAAQVFGLSGIGENNAATISMSLLRGVQKGILSGSLKQFYEFVSVVPGSVKNGNVLLKLPLPDTIVNDDDQQERLNVFAMSAVQELALYLRAQTELFKNSVLSYVAPEAGIRTGPRNLGRAVLTGKHVLSAEKFLDAIARGTWPVEYWEPGKPVRMEYFAMDDHYDIPAGALQSNQIENLFFAGRNISADDTAIASARVIGTCLATGYAAGVMAAHQVKGQPLSQAVSVVQNELFGTPVIS